MSDNIGDIMFDFLKEVNKYHLYDRAKDCEAKIRTYDCMTPMASFFECLLKAAYLTYASGTSEYEAGRISLSDLLSNSGFITYVRKTYSLSADDIETIDGKVRRKSNYYKHDMNPYSVKDADLKECFKCAYTFASGYYYIETGKKAPRWNENDYDQMIVAASENRDQKEQELKKSIIELRKVVNEEIEKKIQAIEEIEKLKKELEDAKFSKVETKELASLRVKYGEIEDLANEYRGRIVILQQKLDDAEKTKAEAEAQLSMIQVTSSDEGDLARLNNEIEIFGETIKILHEENDRLRSCIENADRERLDVERKLEKYGREHGDNSRINELEADLELAVKQREIVEKQLEETNQKLAEAQSRLYLPDTEMVKVSRSELVRQGLMEEEEAPYCPRCGRQLKLKYRRRDMKPFWGCPGWNPYGTGCSYGEDVKQYVYVKRKVGDESSGYVPYIAPATFFGYYPGSIEELSPKMSLFQTISVPREVFSNRKDIGLEDHSRFQVISNLGEAGVEEQSKLIYLLVLRLLNRGIVLPSSKKTEDVLADYFNKGECGNIQRLTEYIKYETPFNYCDSPRENKFANMVFPQVLGPSWNSFVMAQASIDLLANDENKRFVGQRVDFLVQKNGKKIVIELDGAEHNSAAGLFHDRAREDFLKKNGYEILRFRNAQIDEEDKAIVQDINKLLGGETHKEKKVFLDERFLIACKLVHQFEIAITYALSKGLIGTHTNLRAEVSTDIFSHSEIQLLLSVSIAELYELFANYASLYKVKLDIDLQDENEDYIGLYVGDGNLSNEKCILIRDCLFSKNLVYQMESFPVGLLPVNIKKKTLEYFLQYIFGHPGFMEGQYEAISRLLSRKDSIVLLPTGSGKSIIYQLSSFLVPGAIVVVSPLISLIEDQVQNLKKKNGITNAVYFSSARTRQETEIQQINKSLIQNAATLLIYVAPERLQIPSFREDIERMLQKNSVYAVAIDEAHCVSEWGHDFRPAYLNVGNTARRIFKKDGIEPVISALTGTASDAVLNDVRRDLNISGANALIQPVSFDRTELKFSVVSCKASDKVLRIADIIQNEIPKAIGDISGGTEAKHAGIVFSPQASNKKGSQYAALTVQNELHKMIPELGIANYFSKTPEEYDETTWREIIQDNASKFKNDELQLLVATKAFGMGIDKPNIHYIVHDGIPSSFEEYYQEAGRAGRDRGHSECVLVFSNDYDDLNERLLDPNLTLAEFRNIYQRYPSYESDDLGTLLFFHNNAYKGIEDETRCVNSIIDQINDDKFEAGSKRSIFLDYGESPTDTMQAMVRLLVLGIIRDYTYDYNKREFILVRGTLDRELITEKLRCYVKIGSKGTEESWIEKLDLTLEGIEFSKNAVRVLVEYIYDNIERSRRLALRGMYRAAKEASVLPPGQQDAFLRKTITSYFTYSGENRDILQGILASKSAGVSEALDWFDLKKKAFTSEDEDNARDVSVLAGRMLESRPDHPGLLLTQGLAEIILNANDKLAIRNIVAAIEFAVSRYEIDPKIIKKKMKDAVKLLLEKTPYGFEEVISKIGKTCGHSHKELICELMNRNDISEASRDYLLLSYAGDIVNEIIQGEEA